MFALPGLLSLVSLIYLRPQEFSETLRRIPFLYLALALTLFGIVIDWRLRLSAPRAAPQVPWILAFVAWALLTVVLRAPDTLGDAAVQVGVAVLLALLIGHGVQTIRAFQWVAGGLLACCLFLAALGVHQAFAPKRCLMVDESRPEESVALQADGRGCENRRECEKDGEPGADYVCERLGWFGTSTIGGRVRYVGVLEDPNFLAMTIGIALPFAFAFAERKRSPLRLLLLGAAVIVIGLCAIFTKSRGGQLVFLAVIGAYFVKRLGPRGLAMGALFSLPILLFGGRSGAEAESSSMTRLECWYEGMSMVREYPVFGVGVGQFVEHYYQTAHNSYILAPAEMGLAGMFLWSTVIYFSTKIPIVALRRYANVEEAAALRSWAMALLASMAGLLVGIFFLSFNYHYVLWIYVGLTMALSSAIRTHDPEWRIRLGWLDLAAIGAIDAALIVVLFVYTRLNPV